MGRSVQLPRGSIPVTYSKTEKMATRWDCRPREPTVSQTLARTPFFDSGLQMSIATQNLYSIILEVSEYSLFSGKIAKDSLGNQEPTHWKRPWCWERLRAGGKGDRGWDGWRASPIQWMWVWASSGRWWRTGKPFFEHGVLQSMGWQRVRHDLSPEQQLWVGTHWYPPFS